MGTCSGGSPEKLWHTSTLGEVRCFDPTLVCFQLDSMHRISCDEVYCDLHLDLQKPLEVRFDDLFLSGFSHLLGVTG